ncbi:HutD family protein [Streptomyces sp. NPDC088387]|uniref:HutD/Ves family protein n=1 Tax=Streptomyces sp. NPDC088387 TaxID=3365859 RepID=UPI0037FF76E9
MSVVLLHWADYHRVLWKNGFGSTREVASALVGRGQEFDWRVSVADLGDQGPFSVFPGVDRVITVIDGPGVSLIDAEKEHRLSPLAPFAFSGDRAVSCRLPGGPARAVNVMTRRGRATASAKVVDVQGRHDASVDPEETLLMLPLSGQLTLEHGESGVVPLARLDAVRLGGPGDIRITGQGTGMEIRITTSH